MARPRHFPCFDGLRATAAILVVLVHTSFASGFTTRSPQGIYTARLEIGVAVFFLISGFLLYRPFAASHLAGGLAPSTSRFWVRRLLRIVPAYWLAFVVTSYVMDVNTIRPGWRSLLLYLGFAQIYSPSHALTGITQTWSLCTEMTFYAFLPVYAALVAARRGPAQRQMARELSALAMLFGTGIGVRFWVLHIHRPLAYVSLDWLPASLDLFALGMGLAVVSSWLTHHRREPGWLWHPAMPWVSWAAAAGVLWGVSHVGISRLPLDHNPPGRGIAQELLYGLFALFLLAPAVFGPQPRGVIRRVLASPPVVGLGVVSYGVYLWHQAWVAMYLRWYHDLFRATPLAIFAVVAGLAVATATASYLLVERPILKLKDRLGWWAPGPLHSRTSRPSPGWAAGPELGPISDGSLAAPSTATRAAPLPTAPGTPRRSSGSASGRR